MPVDVGALEPEKTFFETVGICNTKTHRYESEDLNPQTERHFHKSVISHCVKSSSDVCRRMSSSV